jgi:uncharacterized membrane protein YfcA
VDLQLTLIVAGLVIGVVVGLTGMGGGALMTPILVIFFGIRRWPRSPTTSSCPR